MCVCVCVCGGRPQGVVEQPGAAAATRGRGGRLAHAQGLRGAALRPAPARRPVAPARHLQAHRHHRHQLLQTGTFLHCIHNSNLPSTDSTPVSNLLRTLPVGVHAEEFDACM